MSTEDKIRPVECNLMLGMPVLKPKMKAKKSLSAARNAWRSSTKIQARVP